MSKDDKWPKFKLPSRRQPVWRIAKKVFRPFFRATVESTIEELPDKAIIVSIHAAKRGPMAISCNYPKFHAIWGHHAMLGTYVDRFRYLRNVLYIQKMHKGKLIATLKATYEAFFSIYIYRGMHIIGTYTDMRFLGTVRNSMEVLNDNGTVILFPEDSSEGYFDEVRDAFPGFVMLAMTYYQKEGQDLPVIPAYISTDKHRFLLGKPRYVHEMELSGLKKQEIANVLRDDINLLFHEYIAKDAPIPPTVKSAPIRTRED